MDLPSCWSHDYILYSQREILTTESLEGLLPLERTTSWKSRDLRGDRHIGIWGEGYDPSYHEWVKSAK